MNTMVDCHTALTMFSEPGGAAGPIHLGGGYQLHPIPVPPTGGYQDPGYTPEHVQHAAAHGQHAAAHGGMNGGPYHGNDRAMQGERYHPNGHVGGHVGYPEQQGSGDNGMYDIYYVYDGPDKVRYSV